jgi:toxin YhaV
MTNRRGGRERRQGERRRGAARQALDARREDGAIEVNGWTILAHPLFLDAIESLANAVDAEQSDRPGAAPSGNAKLLAHLLDLAFDRIPRDPGNAAFRHGGTLGDNRKHWFRGKTGNGRYRLFYRFQSAARIIVYAWVNDENSLRTYGSRSDAYSTFAGMLSSGNPPDDWDDLLEAASRNESVERIRALAPRRQTRDTGGE